METGIQHSSVVRFGLFEVNLRSGELHKQGLRIKVQDQPFQILAMLLARPGDIVTREEIKKTIWPNTFVDGDLALNTAMKKLRQALDDEADQPRYIETLRLRGYRFIAPVGTGVPASTAVISAGGTSPLQPAQGRAEEPALNAVKGPPLQKRWMVAATAGMLLVLLALAGVTRWLTRSQNPIPLPILTRLTWDSGLTTDPALSPDGKLLAYASDRSGDGNLDIYVRQVGGGEPLRLTRGPGDKHEPSFSPDGTNVAFRSEQDGGGIYVVSALGGPARRIVALEGDQPRFSPDGNWIAYTLFRGVCFGTRNACSIYVVPSVGGEPRQVRPDFAAALSAVWSPDGSHLLFIGNPDEKLPREEWV
jgi:DNA-binding winged helix-turn-helix (wHTH) protein